MGAVFAQPESPVNPKSRKSCKKIQNENNKKTGVYSGFFVICF